jgi:hypothetical protein
VLDPGEGLAHWRNPQLGSAHAAIAFDRREPRAMKDTHVLRHRGERHVEASRKLADATLADGELRQDFSASGIGQRGECLVERGRSVNHMV